MSTVHNHFFVDGSALLGDIHRAKIALKVAADARLNLVGMASYFSGKRFQNFLGNDGYRRFTFYFVAEDDRLKSMAILPDLTAPGAVEDIRIEYCGRRIRQFAHARSWLEANNAPQSVQECMYRSEKAVDTQMCCDALQLAASGRLDRLFLYTNDFDFVPLCRALRQFGCNVNLFRLRADDVNADLVKECDAFHVVDPEVLPAYFQPPLVAIPAPSSDEANSALGAPAT